MLTTTTSRILRRHASRASGLHPPVLPVSSTACRRTLFAAAFSRVDVTVRPTLAPRLRRDASGLAAAARETLAAERVRAARIPSSEDLDEAELDAELLPASEITLRMSDRAAERLRAIAAREGSGAALRIGVESGGCHGYQYTMELADAGAAAPEDYHLAHPSITPATLLIDAVSLPLVNGATVDFATELIGSAFRVIDNPHASGKGCGCGVSWELKV